jgi:hypothetical protein
MLDIIVAERLERTVFEQHTCCVIIMGGFSSDRHVRRLDTHSVHHLGGKAAP